MKKVFVVGSGTMGKDIVQVCAQSGYAVAMMDIDESMLNKAMAGINWSLDKLEEKGRLEEPKQTIFSRITAVQSLETAADAGFVIEAIYENLDAKKDVFKKLDNIFSDTAIFGTNTSSLPVTEISVAVSHPERFVGIHFFNPVHRMKLVEIVKGLSTSPETMNAAKEFAQSLGKEPVMVNQDSSGFIVNRINGMAFLEALRLLEKGVASAEDIDKSMRLGLGYPMGPFELMDLVGLDVVLNARMGIYSETREPSHYPPNILRRMVAAGNLGRKTKKGFYEYK